MKGIITFYINYQPGLGQVAEQCIEVFRSCNKDLIEKIHNETGYHVAVIPTTNESCRLERMDFDKPFPRFVPYHVDIAEVERRREERAARQESRNKEKGD